MDNKIEKVIEPLYFNLDIKGTLIFLIVTIILELIAFILEFDNCDYIELIAMTILPLIIIVVLVIEILFVKKLGIFFRKEDFTAKYSIKRQGTLYGFGNRNSVHKELNSFTLRYDMIKKYGFIFDLNGYFSHSSKFDIGFIDLNNRHYHINIKDFKKSDMIEFTKYLYKKTNIMPVGCLKDVI